MTLVAAPAVTGNYWESCRFQLRFQFGDVALGAATLNVQRHVFRLDEIRAGPRLPSISPRQSEGTAGYLLANWPAEGTDDVLSDRDGFVRYRFRSYSRQFIDLNTDFQQYEAKFSGKTRATLRKKIRRFRDASGGTIEFRRYAEPGEMSEFFELARSVSRLTYQDRLLDCGLPSDPTFLATLTAWAMADKVRGYLLFRAGRPVSYLYCPIDDGIVGYAHLGFDPAERALSPGTVLQWLALESLFAERRFRAFDFTEGDGEHKRLFATGHVPCCHLLLLTPNLWHRFVCRSHFACDHASGSLGRLLERHGLKAKVRRLLRR